MSLLEFLSEFAYRRIVVGTALIGLCSGAMGVFLYLRRQSLMSDVIGHAATPGVMGAFLFMASTPALSQSQWLQAANIDARSMPVMTLGALVSSLLAVILANWVASTTRIGIDTTMAVMFSLFLGGGLLLLQVIQRSTLPGKGGIEELMFGNAATLTNLDVTTILVVTIVVFATVIVLWRPFTVMTFDPTLARMTGIPRILDALLLGLLVLGIVIGVKAVGLILMIAFAVFPPAAARQWSRTTASMFVIAGILGGIAGVVGTYLSVVVGKIPTGPVIVLVLAVVVALSLLLSPKRAGAVKGAL